MSGVGKKDMGTEKQELRIARKNLILEIHAKWLRDNGFFKEAEECEWHAKNYNRFEDVRQIRWGERKK